MHVFMFCAVKGSFELPVLYCVFFVVSALVVMCEKFIKTLLIANKAYDWLVANVPRLVFITYAHYVTAVLIYLFHWPDVVSSGLHQRNMDSVLSLQRQIFGRSLF